MQFNYSKVKDISDSDISEIMFKILMGFNVVQKGRKFKNVGEDPRDIPAYKEIFDEIQNEVNESGTFTTSMHIIEGINLEIQFEAENRAKEKQNYFADINIQSRVECLFTQTRQAEINQDLV